MKSRRTDVDDAAINTSKEILEYVNSNVGLSFYDVKAYAYRNDKHDWLAILDRDSIRGMIAECIRDKRRNDGVPYSKSMSESLKDLAEARKEYEERNGKSL